MVSSNKTESATTTATATSIQTTKEYWINLDGSLPHTRRTGKRVNVKVNNWSISFFNWKLLTFLHILFKTKNAHFQLRFIAFFVSLLKMREKRNNYEWVSLDRSLFPDAYIQKVRQNMFCPNLNKLHKLSRVKSAWV